METATKFNFAKAFVRHQHLFRKYRKFTMIKRLSFLENLALVHVTLINPNLRDGAIIECGTWKGGMAAALIEVGGPERKYYFFDSFEGLPPAEDIDGQTAKAWQADKSSPVYFDNCSANLDEFKSTLALAKCPGENIDIRPGFFEQSFKTFDVPPIAVLRLDADWYSSTMTCLSKFWDFVIPGGLILVDDYYTWDGCAKAVHDFLASMKSASRIRQGRIAGVAFIRKE